MPYLYATEDQDYSDYSGGRVIYSQPGAPAFPVRLASEIFQRALRYLPHPGALTLFDPTCGGAYHLTALGMLHTERISRILASDIDRQALALARRNLGLLGPAGLDLRERELQHLLGEYGKESHAGALQSLVRLRARMAGRAVEARVFEANAVDPLQLTSQLKGEAVQLVFCDLPYGNLSRWQLPENRPPAETPAASLLEALRTVLGAQSVVALAADKNQALAHPAYQRLERFQIGKRQVSLLRLHPTPEPTR